MKKIVVPTDFSDCALNALRAAADIARRNDCSITLVHVYERPVYGFVDIAVDNEANRKIRTGIDKEMEKLAKLDFTDGIDIKVLILSDIEIWEMLKNDSVKEADLLVIGSHGCRGWREHLIGSNTEKVVRLAECPVLVIKEKYDQFDVKDIVFVSNFYGETEAVFTKIKKFTNLFHSKIHLLKVITPNQFETTAYSTKVMESFAKKFSLENYTVNIYNDKNVEDGILNFSDTVNADLIAMETHGWTGFRHLINGSLTEDVVNHVTRPVLSVKIKQ